MFPNLPFLGSMPGAVPGAQPPGDTGNLAPAPPMSAPPGVSSAMAGPALLPAFGSEPSAMQYAVETQADGTILIRVQNPDGTTGPVVQHLAAPKLKGTPKPGGV